MLDHKAIHMAKDECPVCKNIGERIGRENAIHEALGSINEFFKYCKAQDMDMFNLDALLASVQVLSTHQKPRQDGKKE